MMTYQDVVKAVFKEHINSNMTPQSKMRLASKTWSEIKRKQGGVGRTTKNINRVGLEGGGMETASLKGGKLSAKQKKYLKDFAKGGVAGATLGVGALAHHLYQTDPATNRGIVGLANKLIEPYNVVSEGYKMTGGKLSAKQKKYLKDFAKGGVAGATIGASLLAHHLSGRELPAYERQFHNDGRRIGAPQELFKSLTTYKPR